MPITRCQSNGQPGYRWGSGKCYTYDPENIASRDRAYASAQAQERAARAAGYRGKEDTCVSCQPTVLVTSFEQGPKKCCAENFFTWRTLGDGQKLKCETCGNLFTSVRIEKGSFIAHDYRDVCAYFLRKAVFATRSDVDKWLSNNPYNRRVVRTPSAPAGKTLAEVDIVRETLTGWVVIIRPYDWFAMGTLKGQWQSVGIVMVTGNLRHDVDDRIPTDAELRATAEFVERI